MIDFRMAQEALDQIAREGDEKSRAIAAEALRGPVMNCPNCGHEMAVPSRSELRRGKEAKSEAGPVDTGIEPIGKR